ncbi:ras-interacting protein 1 isoform X3 [Pelobates fuscus]|uniref:ras-interacting protein 1 isoform X3 n=1 Tax=Pelobates fuscus TaxID=191477 RepID=UPI002FE4ACAD
MFPEEKKEGSPRFGKLHFPVGLWINSPKKHFAKLGRRWPSVGSIKSTTSDTTSRSNETVELRQPTKNKNNRHKRLSNIFHRSTNSIIGSISASSVTGRWASEKKLSEIIDTVPEDLVELSSQKNLPGILKVFGDDISSGTNYKSVLATPRSTARELVKEALERYVVHDSDRESFVLCDVVGRFVGHDGDWKMEYLRIIGDNERALVLQEMWKPKAGFSRRFEIRRKQEVENMTTAEDNETAGINAQARRLQKSRSRAASGGNVPLRDREDSISLRRSISDINLNTKKRRERKSIKSMVANNTNSTHDSSSEKDVDKEMQKSSEGTHNVDSINFPAEQIDTLDFECLSQCLIQPPTEHPYFILLQGYNRDQEKIKEIKDKQPENQQDKTFLSTLSIEDVASDLRPLMLWMANSMELLNFVQRKILDMEKEWESEGINQDALLSSDLEACEESMVLLDEVIMYTFQQCVYYLTKTLYAALPDILESNPFTDPTNLSDVGELNNMPEGTRGTLAIYQATLDLTRECELHPDLVSQTFGYLFFFSNASLFNTLMEKGNGEPFYQWSKAVQIRTNLDLVLDWLQGIGLGDIAAEFFRKLSTTVNLLCIPKTSLLKLSWSNLQNDYPVLNSAQLNHLLRNYHLGVGRSHPAAWDPPEEENNEITNTDIFESFTDHPPLILPCDNFHLQLSKSIKNDAFHKLLCQLRYFVWDLEQKSLPANQRTSYRMESDP